MPKFISISVEMDSNFKAAFDAFASKEGQKQGTLVRAAIDKVYGDALKPYLSFFEQDVPQMEQSLHEGKSA